jgi:DNA polymerase elongation subunit (family B)
MQKKLQFYLLDIEHDQHGSAVLYGRTRQGKKVMVYDSSVKPFFWVLSGSKELKNELLNLEVSGDREIHRVVGAEIHRKSYLDKSVEAIRVVVEKQNDIPFIKDVIKQKGLEKKEIDISFPKRYLIEKGITPLQLCEVGVEEEDGEKVLGEVKPVPNVFLEEPKALAFDIEIYGMISGEEKVNKDPIISIAFYGKNLKKIISWKKPKESVPHLKIVEDEAALIEEFTKTIREYEPDYLLGYFSDGFDFPYLKGRAEKYKIPLGVSSDGSGIRMRKSDFSSSVRIKGLPHIDVFKFVSGAMGNSLNFDSYSLDVVAKEFLLEGKKEFNIRDLESVWDSREGLKELFEYNLRDAELTYRVFEKIQPNLHELVRLVGMTPYDICRMAYGQLVENYLLRKAKEFNEICPNRPKYDAIEERRGLTYEGAFVMEPKPGLYEDIAFFDFLSLYPTVIIAKNISPGTLSTSKGEKTPEIGKGKSYHFDNSKPAFIPKVLREILEQREKVKKQMEKTSHSHELKARSYALKTIANSTYGYMGFPGARWYSRECAESITAWARYYIQYVIKRAEKEFNNVIYADTDSCVVALGKHTRNDAKEFMKSVNKSIPEIMELELEDFYKRGIFVSKKGISPSSTSSGAKKKYALIDDEGKIKIVGFETVRRDWSPVARNTQKRVLEIILREGKVENALRHAREIISKILSKKMEISEMIMSTQLKMGISDYKSVMPHVAVARKLEKKGIILQPGSQVDYVITSKPGIIRDKAEPPKDAKDYDADYYIHNQVIPSVEKIFEVFGITKEQIVSSAKGQRNIGDFK